MIEPIELKKELPMEVGKGCMATTTRVWQILSASKHGDLATVKALADEFPGLIYAQYNYTPPIHFAVREGHEEMVAYLLSKGAHDPGYRIYPFQESLKVFALDRNYPGILSLLEAYEQNPIPDHYTGDNGSIDYQRSTLATEFQQAVNKNKVARTREILEEQPELAKDETFFWGEGILLMPVKGGHYEMIDLLMHYGAKVPDVLKWAQAYYFETYDHARYMMERGMNPNVMSWHHVSLLHDMAQKGNIKKAKLLISHGAEINSVDEEYQSTPLGMAVRWGHLEMVEFLLRHGADPNTSGADWARPVSWARKKGFKEIEQVLKSAGAV
jgi:ankyrin repeat protein